MELELNGSNLDNLRISPSDKFQNNNTEDDFSEEEEERAPMTLGFVSKPKIEWSLLRQHFPSKAGGTPAWLDPVNLPSEKSNLCDFCGDPLQFLLQVYAPLSEEWTFHRSLFVFMCPSMTCLLRDQHEQWQRHPDKLSSNGLFGFLMCF